MACEKFENQLLDYVENQLPAADRANGATHLAGCAECRAFAQQLEQLDTALARVVKAPTLSPDFNARLQQRIQTTVVLSEAERAKRKRQLQAEYEAGRARLGWKMPGFRWLLKKLRYALPMGAAGWFVWLLLPPLASLLSGPALKSANQSLLLSLFASVIFVAVGFAAAFPGHVPKLGTAAFQGRY